MITYRPVKLKLNKQGTAVQNTIRVAVSLLVILSVAVLAFTEVNAAIPLIAEMRIRTAVNALNQHELTPERQQASSELENAGERAVPALIVALGSENPVLRRNAADMLGYIGSPQALAALRYTLNHDRDVDVRISAAWALGEINDLSTLKDLQYAAVLDLNQSVRRTAADSVSRIRTRLALAAGVTEQDLNAFASAPGDSSLIYIATRRDLVLSHDGGKTWQTISNALPSLVSTLAISPTDAKVLYASADGMGLFKSTDGGVTWTAINTDLGLMPGARFSVTAIAFDATNSHRIYITTGVWLGTSHVEFHPIATMRTLDSGATWQVYQKSTNIYPTTHLALKGAQLFALAGENVVIY